MLSQRVELRAVLMTAVRHGACRRAADSTAKVALQCHAHEKVPTPGDTLQQRVGADKGYEGQEHVAHGAQREVAVVIRRTRREKRLKREQPGTQFAAQQQRCG